MTMKIHHTVLVLLLALTAHAQPKHDTICQVLLKVKVIDEIQNPIPAATVVLRDTQQNIIGTTLTDLDGIAQFTVACGREYVAEVTTTGFESNHFPISVSADAKAPVEFEAKVRVPEMVGNSGGHLLPYMVRVYNTISKPIKINFGPDLNHLALKIIPRESTWESALMGEGQPMVLQIVTGTTKLNFPVRTGKSYIIYVSGNLYKLMETKEQ
ncbi:carboxypeptidase-like regulatory domain-containing protein [Flavobacterium sp.]|uniref:carboxypeptidase-like regulatory domain-containing protein n=1 Tax=Flavobacterium sp. TaxID=239 RepID=UPI0026073D07|nr:carboxypeptidase-like regulatory domain-containing protein [Flavobacterium sp.]